MSIKFSDFDDHDFGRQLKEHQNDIVERLRQKKTVSFYPADTEGKFGSAYINDDVCIEAADEIERLREALKYIADGDRYNGAETQYYIGYWGKIARSALQQKESE